MGDVNMYIVMYIIYIYIYMYVCISESIVDKSQECFDVRNLAPGLERKAAAESSGH